MWPWAWVLIRESEVESLQIAFAVLSAGQFGKMRQFHKNELTDFLRAIPQKREWKMPSVERSEFM